MNKIENLEEIVFQVDSKDKIGITVSEIYLKLREVIDHLNTTPTDSRELKQFKCANCHRISMVVDLYTACPFCSQSRVEELVVKYSGYGKLDGNLEDVMGVLRSFAKELLNL